MPAQITEFDKGLASAVLMQFNNGPRIAFQFPPKITSDSRKGEWREDNLPGTEPVAVYEKSGPREISLTWTYIVDGSKEWTTDKVAEQVKLMRGYFARTRDTNVQGQRNLVVLFKMWNFGGTNPMSCRIKNVDVKHSDTIVTHCTNGDRNYDKAYPLRTDITIELRLWTKGNAVQTQDLNILRPQEEASWY